MKKTLLTILACLTMTGCVVYPTSGYTVTTTVSTSTIAPRPVAVVVYESDVYVGAYYVGYYRSGYGYWTGYGWDINFYVYGHSGYGRYYRGAPPWAYTQYRNGGRYRDYRHEERRDNRQRDDRRDNRHDGRKDDRRDDGRQNHPPRRHR